MPHWINKNPFYTKLNISEFDENPLVAALNPIPPDEKEVMKKLFKFPTFRPEERELPWSSRILLPARLENFFFPLGQHLNLLTSIYMHIVEGYRLDCRNPLSPEGQRTLHTAGGSINRPVIDNGSHRAASCLFICGLSGMGKSVSIRRALDFIGQPVIQHSVFNGRPFTEAQIVYLMRNVPEQASAKALCKTFGDYTDSLLGLDYYKQFFSDKSNTRQHYVSQLHRIVASHHVGAIVLDEVQNLSLAHSGGKEQLLALIQNLQEELAVPIILIGTPATLKMLETSMSLARRIVGLGFIEMDRPKNSKSPDWVTFCETVWEFQWVKEPVMLDSKIIRTLYNLSQGIYGIMIYLFVASQIHAIRSKHEVVDIKMLNSIYYDYFKPLHPALDALKSQRYDHMMQFDDFYHKGMKSIRKIDTLNMQTKQIQKIQKKLYNLNFCDKENISNSKREP
jgi:hypothetical protein